MSTSLGQGTLANIRGGYTGQAFQVKSPPVAPTVGGFSNTAFWFDEVANTYYAKVAKSNGTITQLALGGGSGGIVTSVFGRPGDVVAQTGDYTAAQVTNAIMATAPGTQTITTAGVSPVLSIVGNDTGNIYNQLNIASIVNPNFHITLGVDSAAGIGGTFAGDGGVGFIPYCLQVLGGSYVGIGSNGNQSQLQIFPANANNGYLQLIATNSTGNFNSIITNSNVGQTTIYTLIDAGLTTANFILSSSATNKQSIIGQIIISDDVFPALILGAQSSAAPQMQLGWLGDNVAGTIQVYLDHVGGTPAQIALQYAGGNTAIGSYLSAGFTANATLHSVGTTALGLGNAAIVDANLYNGNINPWLDETNNILNFKTKNSTGVIQTFSISTTGGELWKQVTDGGVQVFTPITSLAVSGIKLFDPTQATYSNIKQTISYLNTEVNGTIRTSLNTSGQFRVYNTDTGGGGTWAAGVFGNATGGDVIVAGPLTGVATIGANNTTFGSWANLAIRADGFAITLTAASVSANSEIMAPDFAAIGLTGATQASRYVGATTSGAPVSGTFAVGDYIIDRSGDIWVCTVAGSPGTWVSVGAGASGWTSITYGGQPLLAPATSTKTGVYFTNTNPSAIYNDGSYLRFNYNNTASFFINDTQAGMFGSFFINTGLLSLVSAYASYGAISTPTTPTGAALLYSKTVSGITNLYELNSAGVETKLGAAATFNVVNATTSTYTVLGTEDFIVGGNTGANVNIQVDQAVLTKPLIIQKLFNSQNLTITPINSTFINGSGNPFTIVGPGGSYQGGLVLVSGEDGQNIYVTAGDYGLPNNPTGSTIASNGHNQKWVNYFTANASIAPGGTAQFTIAFDSSFVANIHTTNVSVKESTSGLPINAKVISQSLASVVIEIQNMSTGTTIGANTVSLYVSSIGF